jgi:anaerobic ribonucleoside-triphosphate reductase activating protein
MKIRLSGIIRESIVDGPGLRYVIFTQGCPHHCPACHNPDTHDLNGGYLKDIDDLIIDINKNPLLSGVTLSGGEPFLQIEACLNLVKKFDHHLNLIAYTGYTYEHLLKEAQKNTTLDELLNHLDYLIDGMYIKSLKDLTLPFRGSSNQRIIDLKASRLENRIITTEL